MEMINSSFEEIKRVVFHAIDRLSLDLNSNFEGCILFLLELKKTGLLRVNEANNDFLPLTYKIERLLRDEKLQNKETLNSIWNALRPNFEKISSSVYNDVINLLDSIDNESLCEVYLELIEGIIKRFTTSKSVGSDLYIQPIEITKLISGIGPKANGSIYNPFAGIASYGIELDSHSSYFAEELNSRIWAIGALRLLAHKRDISTYINQDSFLNLKMNSQRYDLIVATPPFGSQILNEGNWIEEFNQPCKVEDYFLYYGVNGLKPDGKLIGLFSTGILYNEGISKKIRKNIVDSGFLKMVISLPSNLFYKSSIASVILVVSKDRTKQDHVQFIDGTTFFSKQSRTNLLDYERLLSSIENADSAFVHSITKEEIIENDYNLSVNRYFLSNESDLVIPEGNELINLGKIAEVFRGERTDGNTGRIVKVGDLSDSVEVFEKIINDFEIGSITTAYQKIDSNVLLVSKIRTLKPTFCKASIAEPIFCNNNILALHVDETLVDIRYLVLELNSERVRNFVNSKFSGVTIPSISIKDILKIPILLPNLDEQRSKFAGFLEATVNKKKEELKSFSKIHGLERDIHEQNAFLRHTLAGPVSNLDGIVKNIQSIIDSYAQHFPDIWKMKVSDKHKFTLKEYVSNLSRDITKISTTIGKQLKKELSLSDNPKEFIDILKFLRSFTEEFNENKPQNYTLQFDFDDNYTDLFETYVDGAIYSPKVFVNRNLLTDLLNNLIENAIKHAFVDGKNNRIDILLLGVLDDIANPKIQILFSNTGKSLPESFTIDDFSRKGNAVGPNAGDGFGGWYITEIIKYFGGTIDLIDETGPEGLPDSDLATSFEITLPVVYEEKL